MKHIALIGGDGIGPEVITATRTVLETLFPAQLNYTEVQAGFEHFERTGRTIDEVDLATLRTVDAVLYGANTNPPGHPSYKSLTLTLRKELGLYANVRPAKSIPGISQYENVDLIIVRENSEDLYIQKESPIPGGFVAERRITEAACERIICYAYELAQKLGKKRVTLVHKANVLRKTCGLFRAVGLRIANDYPELEVEERFVDAMAMEMVMWPERFEVVVTTNMFGDILSDLASGLVGGLGISPSGNIGDATPVFEPVHGSAPDIAGKGVANPLAALLSAEMMLRHIGLPTAADELASRVYLALERGVRTKDLGGIASTHDFIQAVLRN